VLVIVCGIFLFISNNIDTEGVFAVLKSHELEALMADTTQEQETASPPAATLTTISTSMNVTPMRSAATKDLAQQCVQAGQGGVYIKHHRKAGGTTLYKVLRSDVCKRLPVFSSELPYFNAEETFALKELSTSVFVTSIRHPIDRIISLYWFEGRWPRTCGAKCEGEKQKDDTTKVADLDEWIEHVHDR
jgi:hypothetical protein